MSAAAELVPHPRALALSTADQQAIDGAAEWLAANWATCPQPMTKTLRERFGLPFNQAVKAMVKARTMMEAHRD